MWVCTLQGSKKRSSVVAALLGRQLKSSDLLGRKEGKNEKKCKEREKKGKKWKERGKDGKRKKERKENGGKLGKKKKMCKKKQNCLACYQEGENFLSPGTYAAHC